MKKVCFTIVMFLVTVFSGTSIFNQVVDSTSFSMNTRLSFYSFENEGEMLLSVPLSWRSSTININLKINGQSVNEITVYHPGKIIRIPFKISLAPGKFKSTSDIKIAGINTMYSSSTVIVKLPYKSNEVKTDKLTGGLIVNRRLYFPFGFYCYSPVNPTMPEEEIVKGFNMMSPYQKILPETLQERISYMNRCAEVGMKVNYNLLSVSGGGGVGSKIEGLGDKEKNERLIDEIKTFMNHPALLSWYISDEPNGYHIPPEKLDEIYKTIKELDPWHPVSIVFMAPFLSAKKYTNALDIVMADPYPVPEMPITLTGDVAGQLKSEFAGKRPVWMVTQAFGGGELWKREPTRQEIRSMTWQSIINGATGIQYFVRQGPNYFPKSSSAWDECGRIAIEVAELTPWLLSDEETITVSSSSPDILVSSKLHQGQLLVMAVNKRNEPISSSFRINNIVNGKVQVIFENRSIQISNGTFYDQISPYGSQAYIINIRPVTNASITSDNNLMKDSGFEDNSTPGVPSACYARPGGDKGATYFLDTREHFEGNHSVRIVTPEDDKSLALRFFPFQVEAGASYTITIWAKSDPEQRINNFLNTNENKGTPQRKNPQYVEIQLGDFGKSRFVPDNKWRQYVTFVTIPIDTVPSFKTNLILRMPGQGVAWFDKIKVFEEKQ
jgi:hypothetical protein